jgi:spore maturation protein CgeB
MNRRLLEISKAEKPDVMFTVLFNDELDKQTIRQISNLPDTTTVNWFCDDHWRYDNFSRHWAPAFNWVVTTDSASLAKYHADGHNNVIKSQWAANHFLYKKLDLPLAHEVTFVGKPHGIRRELIGTLREFGVPVKVWGQGWGEGRASQEAMIEIFNQSRINLNLSNSSTGRRRRRWQRTLDHARRLARRTLHLPPRGGVVAELLCADRFPEQIKGRNFEVPGCGGFLLTGHADNLQQYYVPSREVACYWSFDDLVRQVRYYLEHDDERVAIAEAGYARTLAEHTYAHRFADIFQRIGCSGTRQTSGSLTFADEMLENASGRLATSATGTGTPGSVEMAA